METKPLIRLRLEKSFVRRLLDARHFAIEWTFCTLNNGIELWLFRLNSVWFRALFTLLSECFSAFPRGTCLLSVFRFVFSFRRYLSPTFRLYYQTTLLSNKVRYPQLVSYGTITRFANSIPGILANNCSIEQSQTPQLLSDSGWAFPSSLAATGGIPFGFFSSA